MTFSVGGVKLPIDLVVFCPQCHTQHIDAPDPAPMIPQDQGRVWINPPHKSHLCHHCGFIWRPCDLPTNGVRATKTSGKDDHPQWSHFMETGRKK